MADYITWADIKYWLDRDAGLQYDQPDSATLQSYVDVVESEVNNALRGYMDVPVDATTSPDTFSQVKGICSRKGAALSIRAFNQVQRDDAANWYPTWLEDTSARDIAALQAGAARPDDAVASANPVVVIPVFAGLDDDGVFKRTNIAGGSTQW